MCEGTRKATLKIPKGATSPNSFIISHKRLHFLILFTEIPTLLPHNRWPRSIQSYTTTIIIKYTCKRNTHLRRAKKGKSCQKHQGKKKREKVKQYDQLEFACLSGAAFQRQIDTMCSSHVYGRPNQAQSLHSLEFEVRLPSCTRGTTVHPVHGVDPPRYPNPLA